MNEEEIQLELPAAKKQRLDNGEAAHVASCSSSVDNIEPSCSNTTAINNDERSCSVNSDIVDVYTIDTGTYSNYVTADEIKRLKEFKVLDEVKSNDEDSNEEESDSSEGRCCCL